LAETVGMGTGDTTDYLRRICAVPEAGAIAYWQRFLLDSGANLTDNYSVEMMIRLIYSPSDMPQGLWRGFAFRGRRAEEACYAD
jgi:hypothetical protein